MIEEEVQGTIRIHKSSREVEFKVSGYGGNKFIVNYDQFIAECNACGDDIDFEKLNRREAVVCLKSSPDGEVHRIELLKALTEDYDNYYCSEKCETIGGIAE